MHSKLFFNTENTKSYAIGITKIYVKASNFTELFSNYFQILNMSGNNCNVFWYFLK